MKVLGIDASLVRSGVCLPDGSTTVWRTRRLRGPERLDWIVQQMMDVLDEHRPDLVVLEGYAYAAKGAAIFNMGELGGVLRWVLWLGGYELVVVPPSTLKKFATGAGNAAKDDVVLAVQQQGVEVTYHDEADAWWLRAIGMQLKGQPLLEPRMDLRLSGSVEWTLPG